MTNTETLMRLYDVIASRKGADAASSYVAQLFAAGKEKISKKLGEEAIEAIIAYQHGQQKAITAEAADVLFHLMVLLADSGVTLEQVIRELERREGTSGLDEKKNRVPS